MLNYVPSTFRIMGRIIDDYYQAAQGDNPMKLDLDDFRIINKIFQSELSATKTFESNELARKTLKTLLAQQLSLL